jgi:ParB family chromosome partitioning protein
MGSGAILLGVASEFGRQSTLVDVGVIESAYLHAKGLNPRRATQALATRPSILSSTMLTATAAAPRDFTVYAFDDVAEQLAANEENTQQTSEEILLSIIDGLQNDKLTGFALRLALTAHTAIPRESEIDFLTALLH